MTINNPEKERQQLLLLDEIIERFIPKESTAEEMSYIDENSTALGIPVQSLMENAGAGVASVVDQQFGAKGKRILIVAGTGNKGGDGFVACRHLLNRGSRVVVVLLGDKDEIHTSEARSNLRVLERLSPGPRFVSIKDSANVGALSDESKESELIIDAMLGTGVKGNLREPFASVVRLLDRSGRPIISIDTPTGLNPSTGEVQGACLHGKLTVTFHKRKVGFHKHSKLTGKVTVVDIGIPLEAELFTGPGDVRRVTTARKAYSSKRDHGYVLIVGGSDVYSGAPVLTALAALRTGAGLALVAAPEKAADVIKSFSPDIIAYPLQGRFFTGKHLRYIKQKILDRVNSVVIGPGVGSNEETAAAVRGLVKEVKDLNLPLVLDADAIRAFTDKLHLLRGSRAVLTPNVGEFKAVTDIEVGEAWLERVQPAVNLAKRSGSTILLKGHHTIITDGEHLKVNATGNPGLATGGTGDVLSGLIAAYLAQGRPEFWSATAGAYIHGRAGDLAAAERGFHLLASDLIEKLPVILKPFDRLA